MQRALDSGEVSPVEIEPEKLVAVKESQGSRVRYWIIRLGIVVLLITLITICFIYKTEVDAYIERLSCWLQVNPVTGPITLSAVYIVITVFSLPGFVLALAAGVAFQEAYEETWCAVLVGGTSVFVGAWAGSNLAMLLARYLFREQAVRLSKKFKLFRAIDHAMRLQGFKFTLLMRLCPIIPYNAYNYVLGVTSVPFIDFALGGIGMIPGCFVYVFIGTTIGSINEAVQGKFEHRTPFLVLLIAGSISALLASIYITIVIRHYLKANMEVQVQPIEKEVSIELGPVVLTDDPEPTDRQEHAVEFSPANSNLLSLKGLEPT